MKTIVAPTDFSEISLNAVNYAADMATLLGANLALLHVYPFAQAISEIPAPVTNEEMMAYAYDQLSELKNKIMARTGDRIKISAAVKTGDVIEEIKDYCEVLPTYAIVMGTDSPSAVSRFLFGAKTISALKKLAWPLIVVPPKAKFRNIQKIGLACDFKNVISTIPVKEIESLLKEFHGELHVLHVDPKGKPSVKPDIEETYWLHEILKNLKPVYHYLSSREIEKSLIDFVDLNHLDMLIIIPKKHNIIGQLFQHGHSGRLVVQTNVPVVAIHE